MIPKIIHQIWVGPNPLPVKSLGFIDNIKNLHPTFEYRLWTDKDITKENFVNYDFIIKTKSYAQKADIMRYEILYRHGGVYLDIDFQLVKPIDSILLNELVVCNEIPDTKDLLSIGFIASVPNNPKLLKVVDGIKNINFIFPVNVATGPVYFRKSLEFDSTVTILNTHVMYPTHWKNPKNIPNPLHPDTIGIHHWDKNW